MMVWTTHAQCPPFIFHEPWTKDMEREFYEWITGAVVLRDGVYTLQPRDLDVPTDMPVLAMAVSAI